MFNQWNETGRKRYSILFFHGSFPMTALQRLKALSGCRERWVESSKQFRVCQKHRPPPVNPLASLTSWCLGCASWTKDEAEMSGNNASAVSLLSYETLVHAVAGAMVSWDRWRNVKYMLLFIILYCETYITEWELLCIFVLDCDNSVFSIRGVWQLWQSSSLWRPPKADYRVRWRSYQLGQRLPDYSSKNKTFKYYYRCKVRKVH